ncbi:MAG TPA: amidase [Caulobacteraceae bacterium]|jgi:aspartyl-tRNA(Asn)/glutamyl-tRNA(Gln) amidotransferase subunit A|nr:amidase [Caulobacteraceae bacterium]
MTIETIQAEFTAGGLTAESLMRAVQARIAVFEPAYNAFVFLNPDALDQARHIDSRRAAGKPLGPLAGIPVAVKDSVDVAAMPTTCCWDRLAPARGGYGLIPERDAPAVARLRRAGAIIVGKTNTPAFSAAQRTTTSWAGTTYNAVDRRLMPAGSSSGSATAVSAGFAVVGVAEETGGSIQNPAGAQSLVAIRPTFGLTPNTGVAPMAASTRDVVGPHAKSVRDAAWMLDVMAGYTVEDPKTLAGLDRIPQGGYGRDLRPDGLRDKRLGTFGPGWRTEPLSPGIVSQYDRALGQIASLGATMVDDPFKDTPFASYASRLGDLSVLESIIYDFGVYLRRNPSFGVASFAELAQRAGADPFDEGQPLHFMRDHIRSTADASPPDLVEFIAARRWYLAAFGDVMAAHQLDGLVFPQMMAEVPPLVGNAPYLATATQAVNIAGLPGVVVPAGRLAGGSPFALIFIGRPWSEAALLSMAYAYEQGWPSRVTPVLRA